MQSRGLPLSSILVSAVTSSSSSRSFANTPLAQATIVAVGTVKKVAIPAEGEDGTTVVEWDEQIVLTGSFDHKVVDGAVGATFMQELKKVVENPLDLLL